MPKVEIGDILVLVGVMAMVVGVGVKLEEVMKDKEKVKTEVVLGTSQEKSGIININTANKRQLMDLPGIGEKMAQRIIDYRFSIGRFKSKEQIKEVKGVGEKTYESLKNKISI